jgi:plastocyanin
MRLRLAMLALSVIGLGGVAAAATVPRTITLTLKEHRFSPAEVTVPVGQKVRVLLINQDAATEEFDSHDLKVEELVTPHGHTSFTIGPLGAGTYSFMGEFHAATAQGRVTATPGQL